VYYIYNLFLHCLVSTDDDDDVKARIYMVSLLDFINYAIS